MPRGNCPAQPARWRRAGARCTEARQTARGNGTGDRTGGVVGRRRRGGPGRGCGEGGVVRVAGLEPARLAAGVFETPASTVPPHPHVRPRGRPDRNEDLDARRRDPERPRLGAGRGAPRRRRRRRRPDARFVWPRPRPASTGTTSTETAAAARRGGLRSGGAGVAGVGRTSVRRPRRPRRHGRPAKARRVGKRGSARGGGAGAVSTDGQPCCGAVSDRPCSARCTTG